jgi:EmrB/QacA subfamily drug resistance transporter
MPLGSAHKWWTLAVVGSGTFMAALDGSVVNVALPVIRQTTLTSISTVEWVILAYYIVISSSLLVFGRLSDLYGKRFIYMAGQLVFVLGSLGCGLAGRIEGLIVARAIQAVGAAMMIALSPSILISAFPGSERGRALGLQATVTYLGLSIGPALGGFLTQHFGWPSIFYVNIPVGLCALAVAHKVLRSARPAAEQPFDPAGASTMAVGLAALLFVLSKGGDLGWSHPLIAGSAVLAAGVLAAFVAIERRSAHPALDFGLFSNRTFSASVLAAYLCYVSTAAVGFLMPFYFLSAAGYTASQAGLLLMAVPLAMLAVTGPSGVLSDKVGARLPATLGMVLMAIGIARLGLLRPEHTAGHVVVGLALAGIGAGLFTSPNNSAIMGSVPQNRQGVAGAILGTARTIGFASGVAVAGLIFMAAGGKGSPDEIANAVRLGLRATAVVALAGAVCSALRGSIPATSGA